MQRKQLDQLISQLETALSGSQAEYDQIQLERMQKKTALSNAERRLFESRSEQTVMQFSGLRAVQSLLDRGDDLGKVFGTLAHLGKVTPDFVQALDVAAQVALGIAKLGAHFNDARAEAFDLGVFFRRQLGAEITGEEARPTAARLQFSEARFGFGNFGLAFFFFFFPSADASSGSGGAAAGAD